jgi:glycosyltransferase involved in cell wall biosynthesis
MNQISLIIPSYNNLNHLKNAYTSIRNHADKNTEIILIDDASNDGTWEWMQKLKFNDNNLIILKLSDKRLGHTILYDIGIKHATRDVVGVLHADMIIGPNYIENIIKHLKKGIVVCATRIEPPLHPEGKEKIIKNFGLDFDSLNINNFNNYCLDKQIEFKDQTTKGMFAPWIIYKEDFNFIGGHDPLFAPFPYEDSDIFQRWILAGYQLIQSRDSFVYHLTCRGHRWNNQIGIDDDYYKQVSQKASRNYLRKWGSWIKNDEYQYPIISHKYNIGFNINNCTLDILKALEPWCSNIKVDLNENQIINYINIEQSNTSFNLKNKINNKDINNDIIVEFDALKLTQQSFNILTQLSDIITSSGEIGSFELDIFKITINWMTTYENDLIHL